MKKIVLATTLVMSLFASSDTTSFPNIQPPAVVAPCTSTTISFEVFKGSVCGYLTALGGDLKPRCIELGVRRALGLNLDELKHYEGKEALAYLEKEREN